jgi:hypothetical protein
MKRTMIAVLALFGGLALGAACEQKGSSSSELGGTTSAPMSRGPGGDSTSRRPSDSTPSSSANAAGAASDLAGTGGSGDAGMGRDAGTMMR